MDVQIQNMDIQIWIWPSKSEIWTSKSGICTSNARDLDVQIPNLDIQLSDLDIASGGDHQARPSTSNTYLCKSAIDKATILVVVARQSHQNTTLRNNSNV